MLSCPEDVDEFWTMTFFFKHFDYVDDICLLIHWTVGPWSNGSGFGKRGVDLTWNYTNQTKVLSLAGHRAIPICINSQIIEGLEYFVYLRNVVSADSGTELNVFVLV